MTVTMYGGSDTSYANNGGIALGVVTGTVWQDLAKTIPITALTLSDGVTAASNVTTASNGHYKFGVTGWNKGVYVDFGLGPFLVMPADMADRLGTLETTVTGIGVGGGAALTGGAAWAATHAYAVGNVFIKPSNGQYRVVNVAYTSGASYTGTDDTNSAPTSPVPYAAANAVADTAGAYAPISGAYRQVAFRTGQLLYVGLELDGSGIDMPAAGSVNQVVATTDFYSVGADIVCGLWQLNSSNVEAQVAAVPILASKVGVVWPVSRVDTATVTSGSATVLDSSIGVYDKGRKLAVTTGIPANTYVGQTMTPGTSFKMSSSATSQVDVTATANASAVTVGASISFAKDDQFFVRPTQVGSTYAGRGLKVRLMLGSETARVNTTPGVPSGLSVTSTTSTSVTLGWTLGTNSSQTGLLRDGSPYALLGTSTSYVDLGPNGTGLTPADAAGHTYATYARRGNANSAATSTVTGAPTSDYIIVPQALSGAMDGAKTTVTLGSSSGTAATFGTGGTTLTVTSGAAGSFNANDRVHMLFVGDAGSYTAWQSKGKRKFTNTGDIWDLQLSANSNEASAGLTNGVGFTIGAFTWKCTFKAASFGSGSGGTGSNGSSQVLTDSAYPITSSTSLTSGGSISWGSSLVAGTVYGYKARQVNNGDGTQTITFFYGTSAQYDADTLPLVATITLNTAMKSAMAAGKLNIVQEGASAATANSTDWSAMVHTPLAV